MNIYVVFIGFKTRNLRTVVLGLVIQAASGSTTHRQSRSQT